MTQADLILSSIMDIKGDIGEIKGIQSGLQAQMDTLDKSMESLELTYVPSPIVQVSKNQAIVGLGTLILALCGIGASL